MIYVIANLFIADNHEQFRLAKVLVVVVVAAENDEAIFSSLCPRRFTVIFVHSGHITRCTKIPYFFSMLSSSIVEMTDDLCSSFFFCIVLITSKFTFQLGHSKTRNFINCTVPLTAVRTNQFHCT